MSENCMMLPRIIFCTAVLAATLVVILLSLLPQYSHNHQPRPWLDLSLYVHHTPHQRGVPSQNPSGAFIFRHILTEGPKSTSHIIGRAQGFVIPIHHSLHSAFNIIHLTFDAPEYSGSLSVEARSASHGSGEELMVVGGTGAFAFARGFAVFARAEAHPPDANPMYHIELRLRFPGRLSGRIPR